MSPPRRNLLLVTAGLELSGGGRALVGRLLAASAGRFAADAGIGFEVWGLRGGKVLAEPFPFRGFDDRSGRLAVALWHRQSRPDRPALLFDLLGLARPQAWVPRAMLSPYALMILGIEVWRPLSWDRRRAVARARQVLAISRHTAERARPFLPPVEPAILPLTLEERAPAGAPDPALLDGLGHGFLLTVGRMSASERYKGHDTLLAALPALKVAHPRLRWVVAGEGDDRPRLERRAAELGLSDAVRFTGFLDEATLGEVYRRCGALVMVSPGEGFGLVYLEAMRAGRPCVAARDSAAGEVVMDGETGILVPPDDPVTLAAAVDRLLSEPTFADRLGSAGTTRWAEVFSHPAFEARLWSQLDRLTAIG